MDQWKVRINCENVQSKHVQYSQQHNRINMRKGEPTDRLYKIKGRIGDIRKKKGNTTKVERLHQRTFSQYEKENYVGKYRRD